MINFFSDPGGFSPLYLYSQVSVQNNDPFHTLFYLRYKTVKHEFFLAKNLFAIEKKFFTTLIGVVIGLLEHALSEHKWMLKPFHY